MVKLCAVAAAITNDSGEAGGMKLSARARNVIDGMRNPDRICWIDRGKIYYWRQYSDDGEWFNLARVVNVGAKTIAELLSVKLIERKDEPPILYRLIADTEDLDFGDLWVA
jgi:hypothetical protein